MRKSLWALVLGVACALFVVALAGSARAAGLKTTFVRVKIENLRVGNTYSIREMANLPLAVYNTGEEATNVRVEPTVPIAGELREGYEPIPDASWIKLEQDLFEGVKPNGAAITDVLISIPDDERLLGRRYQVMIWSHTEGEGLIACGLKGEVLFAVSSEKSAPRKAITVLPTEIYIADVEPGKVFSLKAEGSGVVLRIFNPLGEAKRVTLKSIPVAGSQVELKAGYAECPEPGYLKVGTAAITLPAHGQGDVDLAVCFPGGAEYRGKQYQFVVAVNEIGETSPIAYSAIYVVVKK